MKKNSFKTLVKHYLNSERLKHVPRGYDLIGHIAILEFPDKLKKNKKLIARAILETNRNIKTVLEKASERTGEYRIRKYTYLVGQRKYETVHKEYGCLFKLNPTKAYFSPRELTERQRIAEHVKPNETVMVMFSGIAPLPVVIGKKQPKVKKIIAVEINPDAVKYAKENIRINKLSDKIIAVCGDVRKVCEEWFGMCDRVIMPLPLGAENFLDVAMKCLKRKGGVIHFYSWGEDERMFDNALKLIRENMKVLKKQYKVLNKKRVLPYAPRVSKVCVDFEVAGVAKSG